MRVTQLLGGVVAVLLSAGSAMAGAVEAGGASDQQSTNATVMRFLRPLADQGSPQAQFMLGVGYSEGRGVPQDHSEAAKWWRKAADQGLARAQADLGFAYGDGVGVPQDYVLAHMWLNLAAAQGDELAKKARDQIAPYMTPDQIAEAQRMAREWTPTK